MVVTYVGKVVVVKYGVKVVVVVITVLQEHQYPADL